MKPVTPTAIIVLGMLAAVSIAPSPAQAREAIWRPVASERLVKLPAAYLKKAIDKDFAQSALGAALASNREAGDLKAASLEDLARAREAADGELRLDLRQQLLGEKQAFIRIMGDRQRLERDRVNTRLRLLRALVRKLDQDQAGVAGKGEKIRASQNQARQRFESSLSNVDDALFASGMAPESRYAQAHDRNIEAIEKLRGAIAAHPMNRSPDPTGEPFTKREYLERMSMEAEAHLAILDQEEQVLGFMAKLVALDAMAFADELDEIERPPTTTNGPAKTVLSSAVRMFIQN
jgi:hypothetical protein